LNIAQIDDGSAKPKLVAMLASAGALLTVLPPEFIEARDLINSVIGTESNQSLPPQFPKELYSYFNRLGRSLRADESIEWAPESATNKAELTQPKRKRLVLAQHTTYEAGAEIVGLVEELDAGKKTGILRAPEGRRVPIAFDDPFFGELKAALGVPTRHVCVSGVGVFDVNDRLQSISSVREVDAVPHYPLTSAIEKLASLNDGWLEGHGVAPIADNLNSLSAGMAESFPNDLEYPSVTATEDGNVVLEWIRPHTRIELEVNFTDRKLELYATSLKSKKFEEKTFTTEQWQDAFARVSELLLS